MVDSSDSTPPGGATVANIARERAELIEKYAPYVRSIAQKMRATAGAQWSLEQLVEYGNIGLLEAAERYDPRVDENFMTRAYYAIRGAINDALRRAGSGASIDDAKLLFATRANEYLASMTQAGGPDNPFELATKDLAAAVQALAVVYIASSDAVGTDGMDEARALVRKAMAELHDRERKLFKLLYYRGLNLTEAAERLGLSKARAQRLHLRVIHKTQAAVESKFAR